MKPLLLCLVCLISQARAEYIEITDSNGKIKFRETPQRVVVLNWTLAEQLLALGIEPVGMADIKGYNAQTAEPYHNPNTTDVGSRLAPNLKSIKSLNPDVIIVGYSQRPLIRSLSHISTVVYFKNFSRRYHNADKADERLMTLAQLFNQTPKAKDLIKQRQNQSLRNQERIRKHFGLYPPKVNVLVIDDADSAWVFGANSMPQYAIEDLGLKPAIMTESSQFGVNKVSVDMLAEAEGCFFFISHNEHNPLDSHLWQQSKAAQSGCLLPLPTTALYGGSVSLLHLSNLITQTLLNSPLASPSKGHQ